jgi:DNA-binding MarR family transcriptional regulator
MEDFKRGKANSLGFLISDTARLLRKRFDQRTRGMGLTRAQWQVLAHLAMHEGINQAGLAEILEIEPITLSRHLEKLETGGWVARRPDPKDKRGRIPFLTEKAMTVLGKVRTVGRCLIEEVTSGMTPDQVEGMKLGLQHVRDALSTRDVSGIPVDDRSILREKETVQ